FVVIGSTSVLSPLPVRANICTPTPQTSSGGVSCVWCPWRVCCKRRDDCLLSYSDPVRDTFLVRIQLSIFWSVWQCHLQACKPQDSTQPFLIRNPILNCG
ncbi:hypothetical protein EDC04DRAFT_2774228, partial [Pisolithus marmoratus]